MDKKNVFKVLGIIAVVALIGLSMTACDLDLTSTVVDITGIDAKYNGMSVVFLVMDNSTDMNVEATALGTIKNGSISLDLVDPDKLLPVKVSGNKCIGITITPSSGGASEYVGIILSQNINKEKNTIPFSKFN